MALTKPRLSFWQIINMNVGFFGIQYSFGLQQSAVNPIYDFLGAKPDEIPWLNLAGPLTGLVIQPIIGALSDKTWHPRYGRRTPYFFIGAIICSIALFLFPFSSALWMAAGLLWILDAGNNTAMEPYRAFIAAQLKSLPSTEQVYTMVKKLKDYILSQKAGATGNPMLNVFTRDSLSFDVRVAIPVDRRLPDAGEIHYKWMLGGGNILITEVKGGPEEIKKAYNQVNHYITDYKRLAPAIPFESMVTDRTVEKDSSQWITRIYYPVI